MFCKYCGHQMVNPSRFCTRCGGELTNPAGVCPPPVVTMEPTPVTPAPSPQEDVPNAQPRAKKSAARWLIPLIAFLLVLASSLSLILYPRISNRQAAKAEEEAKSAALTYVYKRYGSSLNSEWNTVTKNGKNDYTISCDVKQDCDFWQLAGSVKMSVSKDAGDWTVDVIEDTVSYTFKSNDNWYYITASGNRSFLIKIIGMSKDRITLEYYSYDMGSYGSPDTYNHTTIEETLKYDETMHYFTFVFMGDWRIDSYDVKYNKFEVGAYYEYYQSGDFRTLNPVNPEDYWWYERAKAQDA